MTDAAVAAAAAAAVTLFNMGKKDLLIYDRFNPVTLEICLTVANGFTGVAVGVAEGLIFS